MRSNLSNWQNLQRDGYFDTHPDYANKDEAPGAFEADQIPRYVPLDKSMNVAVIGCGFGRESSGIAPLVGHVYGIDVDQGLLDRAHAFVARNGSTNFTPVLAERFETDMPSGIDLVYSMVVMQHLTRDLVANYFRVLGSKLSPRGRFMVQFLQMTREGYGHVDAPLEDIEPSVSWTCEQIIDLVDASGLQLDHIRTIRVAPGALWHWLHATRH